MRRLLLIAGVLAVLAIAAAPPAARPLPAPAAGPAPVRGAVHIHTERSDGTGTVEQVARAAARAGLRFVIVTDHADATRAPAAPRYVEGVLVIDGVEISTDGGHVVALGLPRSPYPLAGEARDVIADVVRMGGLAIAAHPASRKADLRWTEWTAPIAGLEYLNVDSEWRDEPPWVLARTLLAYPVRRAETLSLLFDRQDEILRRWDAMTATRRVVALAAADAHGSLALLRREEPYRGRLALPMPGYEPVFRTVSLALPHAQLSADPDADADVVLREIGEGRVFSSVDALARHPMLGFTASSGAFRATLGESLRLSGPVHIRVAVQAPSDARIVLWKDGAQAAAAVGASLDYEGPASRAVYRVEVALPGAPGTPPIPWIVSNPIYAGRTEPPPPPAAAAAAARADLYVDGPAPAWTVEHSAASQAAVDVVNAVPGTQLLLRYAIAGAASTHPYAALVVPAGDAIAAHDRLTFTARSDRPTRVSVQLRVPTSDPDGERWHRSVFVDATPREVSVRFDDMRPRGPTSAPRPPLGRVGSLLFVLDTVNTPAGTAGQLALDDVRYER